MYKRLKPQITLALIILLVGCNPISPLSSTASTLVEQTQTATILPTVTTKVSSPTPLITSTAIPTASDTQPVRLDMSTVGYVVSQYEYSNCKTSLLYLDHQGNLLKTVFVSCNVQWLEVSSDGRYVVYDRNDIDVPPVILQTEYQTRFLLPEESNCSRAAWAKNETSLAFTCVDGIHIKELVDDQWQTTQLISTEEIIPIEVQNNIDYPILNFPAWWADDARIGFVKDYSQVIFGYHIDTFNWIERNSTNTSTVLKEIHQTNLLTEEESIYWFAAHPTYPLIAAQGPHGSDNIVVYNIDTGTQVMDKKVNQPDENASINSLKWSPARQVLFYLLDNKKIGAISIDHQIPVELVDLSTYAESLIDLLWVNEDIAP
jgi:hypothetical protein